MADDDAQPRHHLFIASRAVGGFGLGSLGTVDGEGHGAVDLVAALGFVEAWSAFGVSGDYGGHVAVEVGMVHLGQHTPARRPAGAMNRRSRSTRSRESGPAQRVQGAQLATISTAGYDHTSILVRLRERRSLLWGEAITGRPSRSSSIIGGERLEPGQVSRRRQGTEVVVMVGRARGGDAQPPGPATLGGLKQRGPG